MARLLTWDDSLGIRYMETVEDPNLRGSGSNTDADGGEQTFDGIGDVWAFSLGLRPTQDRLARRLRGTMSALNGGANAMRVTLFDPDMMSPAEAGINVPAWYRWDHLAPQPWSNGQYWTNGEGWKPSPPVVKVTAAAAADTGIISLENKFWGHRLDIGDRVGFFPFHFGMYQVTEVLAAGTYRVKHRLRKAITTSSFCTLMPRLVLKPKNKTSAMAPGRNLVATDETSILLVEVIDPYVRSGFTS